MQLRNFLFLFITLFSASLFAQDEGMTLKNAIDLLEKKHQISFNYTKKNADNEVFITVDTSLNEVLVSLEKQTSLRFEKLEKSNKVLVRPFLSTDKVSICGFTHDNGFPIANVEVKSLLETNNTAITNSKGYFKIENVLYTEHVALMKEGVLLKTVSVAELYKLECPNIYINVVQEQLNEVRLIDYLSKGITKSAQKITLKPFDFEVLAGNVEPDVFKNLEHIPGVQSPFEAASQIYVRGGTPDQNLVLWNGIKTYSQSHLYGILSAFNPYVVEQVDFYNKGINSKYGDRISSVIDIQSSKKVVDTFSAGIGTNLLYGDTYIKLPIIKDKLSVEASVRRSYTDFWESPTYMPIVERIFQNTNVGSLENSNTDFYFLDYNYGIQAKISKKDDIQINALYSLNDLDFNSSDADNFVVEAQETENEGYSMQWQHQYSDAIQQYSKINLTNYTFDALLGVTDLNEGVQKTEFRKNYIQDYGGQTYLEIDFQNKHKLQLGYEYSNNDIRYSVENQTSNFDLILDEVKNTLNTHSVFGEFKLNKPKSYLFDLGIRANKYSTSSTIFIEPRFYGEVALFDKFNLHASATLLSQGVTRIQNSLTNLSTIDNFLWRVTDNEEFNILTSAQVSFGATYKSKSWFIELDNYYKKTNNITSLTAGFLNPVDSGFHVGENKTFGTELFVKKKFRNYSTWISYTYTNQNTKFDNINDGDFFTSNLNIDHTFKWLHFYKLNQFQFSVSWLWHTGRNITDVRALKEEGKPVELFFDEINEDQLPTYHKLDASVLYDFDILKAQRCQLGLSIQNVYNRKTILNREFRTTPGIDNNFFTLNYFSLGITPNVSFRIFW